jgi:hypothetical protein
MADLQIPNKFISLISWTFTENPALQAIRNSAATPITNG